MKDKKQVMLIVPMLDQGGLERVCAMTAKLLEDKYEVHLVVFNAKGMIYDVSGADMVDLGLGAVNGKAAKVLNVFKRIRRVRKLKKDLNIQLSYSFGPTANIVNMLSRQKDFVWAGIRGYGAVSNKFSMKLVCSLSDRVISCTKVMEQQINDRFSPKKSAVLYNPCDIAQIKSLALEDIDDKFGAFFKQSGKIIVSMGREHDVKGFWHLIKAVYLVKKRLPDARLMIIGAGDYSEYEGLAKRLGISDDVLFTGVQKNPFALLARADLYALTSESEGFPNALIEAMALGIPCVSVNCLTGPAEILNGDYIKCCDQNINYQADFGILAKVFKGNKDLDETSFTAEEENFANEIVNILTDEDLYRHYQQASTVRVGEFGMERYVKNITKLIETDTSG